MKRLLSSLLLLANIQLCFAQVDISINDKNIIYDANPRLAEVLETVANDMPWYWPSAQLFKLKVTEVELQRQALIKLLEQNEGSDEQAIAHRTLMKQIKSWHLGDRISIKIDYDLARYSLNYNPRIENGKYLLTLSKRPTKLEVFGAVAAPISITYVENKCVKDLLNSITRLENADLNQVYIIAPTGKIDIAPVAYWNHHCVIPMPGSAIYIPLQENQWFEHAKIINQKVSSLALNRITKQ